MIAKLLKILKKTSKLEFISVKLQVYSVQIAHYFRKLFQKLVFLKEHFSKSLCCSVVLILALLPKPGLTLDLTEEAPKIHPWWKLFFSKNAVLEFSPCDFIKNELHHRDYLAWVLQGTFFNILENFLGGNHYYFFYTGGYNSTERTRTTQLGLDIYNCVIGSVYI